MISSYDLFGHFSRLPGTGVLLAGAALAWEHLDCSSANSPPQRGCSQTVTLPTLLSVEVQSNASEENLGRLFQSTVSAQGLVLRSPKLHAARFTRQ